MVLMTGAKLGPYEIIALLGAGGMGEVYRARDTRLDRTVAIKVLPSHLSNNSEARQRFEREARAISALNHPNICTLFDIGHQDGVDFLVMELLEGETLSDRLTRGRLPIDKLLTYGQEICSALQKAHNSGVVHRDLKPSNIMLTKSGAKLMDFGLAKSSVSPAPEPSSVTVSLSTPAAERALTAEGSLVGTFQYMSPEQVEGKEADARSDIFSLGAVLYEMATGKRAFEGKTTASVIAAVMTSEPQPISAIQPLSPPALDRLIRTCLAKDPDQRFQNVHDVSLQLSWIAKGGSQVVVPAAITVPRKNRERLAWSLTAIGALAVLLFAFFHFRGSAPEAHVVRVSIQPPENGGLVGASGVTGPAVLSPDARSVAFIARVAGLTQLWVRPLDSFTSHALPGTEYVYGVVWSPDGRNLAFFAQGKLKRVSANGGPVSTVCDVDLVRGASWNRQDVIIFARFPGGIYRVPASGGVPQAVTQLDSSLHAKTHRWPYFLPDGNHFLYMADITFLASDENVFKVGSLDGKTDRILFHASSPVAYDSGYLLFMINDKLMARRFDPDKMELLSDPVVVAEDVEHDPLSSNGVFSASGTGALLYEAGNASNQRKMEMLDARGSLVGTLGDPGRILDLRVSPDGKRVAYVLVDENTGKSDIWVHEIATGNRIRITRDPRLGRGPSWSHDGTRIAYTSGRVPGKPVTYSMPASGMGEEQELWALQGSRGWGWISDWTPDSRALVGEEYTETGKTRISMALIDGKGQTVPLLETAGANVYAGRLSADGRWIAYMSDESGKPQVYVSGFPVPGGRLQVSSNGGRSPLWRGDGRQLYYFVPETNAVNVVTAELNVINGTVEVTRRHSLFQLKPLAPEGSWDVFPDGKRFLITVPKNDTPVPLSLVLNWTADLKK
jgi:eukaryotic-like serine/threonine-protein kinase